MEKSLEKMSQEKQRTKYTLTVKAYLEEEWHIEKPNEETIRKIMGFG